MRRQVRMLAASAVAMARYIVLVGLCALPAAAQMPQGLFNAPGRYEIESVASDLVLDVKSDNQTVQQYSRSNGANQQWDIQPAGGGYFYVRSVAIGKVLSLAEGSNRDGTHIIVSAQRGGDDQLWQISSTGPAEFQIVSKFSKMLDVPKGSHDAGEHLQIWSPAGNDHQKFRLILVNAGPSGGTSSQAVLQHPVQPETPWDSQEGARACKNEVARHIADLPLSDISVDPIGGNMQENNIVIWLTARGSSGYCRLDRLNRMVDFKVEEMSR
jgi:Ricin-type beta-trefoil lectin domain-like